MIASGLRRTLALAGVLGATMGAATAGAQTVVVRGVPAGTAVELLQDGARAAASSANDTGDATMTGTLSDPGEVRVNLFVDACASVRRVVLTGRDVPPPAPQADCTRAAVPGVFVVRPISTIVVNLSGAAPSVLLRQGPFDLRPAKDWSELPGGLVISAGGGFGKLHNAGANACGAIEECPGDDAGVAFGGAVGFWLTKYLAVEASYLKPATTSFEGSVPEGTFLSTMEPHVLMFVGKIGGPIGPVRLYGQGGATYHRASISNVQKTPGGIEDRFDLRTAGWGWTFGAGFEAWVAPAVAIYSEGGRAALKGGGVETGGEGRLDERLTFAIVGLRVSLNR